MESYEKYLANLSSLILIFLLKKRGFNNKRKEFSRFLPQQDNQTHDSSQIMNER